MDKMKPVLERWVLVTFEKVSVKLHNLRVPDSNGVPVPWMKWKPHPETMITAQVHKCEKVLFLKS